MSAPVGRINALGTPPTHQTPNPQLQRPLGQAVVTPATAQPIQTPAPAPVEAETVSAAPVTSPAPVRQPVVRNAQAAESLAELNAKRAEIEAEINARKNADRDVVFNQIKTTLDSYGFELADLVEFLGGIPKVRAKRTVKPAAPKYKDPNSDATWNGRGAAPKWFKANPNAATEYLIAQPDPAPVA